MSDWTSGYVADIGYSYGYYTELNPQRARLALLDVALQPPRAAGGNHCELGFGQGLSINIHAATIGGQWYGTDFNPVQAAFAQELAAASAANVHLYDQAFAEFCQRDDLPDFDSIGLHGIWSWISDENRAVIVDFVRRKLKVGGLLYISYNTQPGWAAMVPLRELLTEHAKVMAAPGQPIAQRIDGAMAFAQELMDSKPGYSTVNTQIAGRLQALQGQNREYLAHEYFNQDWVPMLFSTLAKWLSPAKINLACSAHYPEHIDLLNLNAEQQALLKKIPDPVFRQTVRDFCVNQQFRKDYWVKGARSLNEQERHAALRAERFVLVQPRADVPLQAAGAAMQVNMAPSIYGPILDVLADHQPHTLAELEQAIAGKAGFAQVAEAAVLLIGTGALACAQDDAAIAQAEAATRRLNRYLAEKSRTRTEVMFLASPVTGGGIAVSRIEQLFLLARASLPEQTGSVATPLDWVQFVWQILQREGVGLVKDGQLLTTAEGNLAELREQVVLFMQKRLPILDALRLL